MFIYKNLRLIAGFSTRHPKCKSHKTHLYRLVFLQNVAWPATSSMQCFSLRVCDRQRQHTHSRPTELKRVTRNAETNVFTLRLMSDVANRARFSARFGARFISVLVITGTEKKRAPKRAPNRARFATSDISLTPYWFMVKH